MENSSPASLNWWARGRFYCGDRMPVTVTRTGPGLAEIAKDIQKLDRSEILVGIQSKNAQRKDEKVNNAGLLFIHTHGSPLKHIPPRPVLEPAIEANRKLIEPHLIEAANNIFVGRTTQAVAEMRKAGEAAVNAAQRWFTDSRNHWRPNAPSTIRRKGSARPLIDTGALKGSISYVVRERDK